ncbi:unnamed protein product [Amoebophrya sp. A25]|nr:unnamed protein product [Amoebophrya sp. A25]|eukprot:GSA25T00021165001.1
MAPPENVKFPSLTEDLVLSRAKCAHLDQVRNLNLWGNDLVDISLLERLPNLEVCSLSVNRIQSLRHFAACKNLRELYLRKNDIRDLQEIRHLEQLQELKVLWLADNPIADVENYKSYVRQRLPQLQRLDSTLYQGGLESPSPTVTRAAAAASGSGSATGDMSARRGPSRRSSLSRGIEQSGSVKKPSAREIHEALWKNENPHMATLDSRDMRNVRQLRNSVPDHELVLHPNHERRRQEMQEVATSTSPEFSPGRRNKNLSSSTGGVVVSPTKSGGVRGGCEKNEEPIVNYVVGGSSSSTSSGVAASAASAASIKPQDHHPKNAPSGTNGNHPAKELHQVHQGQHASPPKQDYNAKAYTSADQAASMENDGYAEQHYPSNNGVNGHPHGVANYDAFVTPTDNSVPPMDPPSQKPVWSKVVATSPENDGHHGGATEAEQRRSDNILCAIMALLHEVDVDGLRMVMGTCEGLLEQKG